MSWIKQGKQTSPVSHPTHSLKILHLERMPKTGHSLLISCPKILCTADNSQFLICKQCLVPDQKYTVAIRLKSFLVTIRKEKSDSIITNDNDLEAVHVAVSMFLTDLLANVCCLVGLLPITIWMYERVDFANIFSVAPRLPVT